MIRLNGLFVTLIGAATAATLSLSAAVAGEREQQIAEHGDKMVAMFMCGHYATHAFGDDEAKPYFASGMEEGRAFYEGAFSKDRNHDELREILPMQLGLSIASVSPDFSLGYAYSKLEVAAYATLYQGTALGSSDSANLNSTKASELYSLANCEAPTP